MASPLSPFAVDSLRRRAEQGQPLPSLTYPGCELSACLELACAHHDWRSRGAAAEACALVERWARVDGQLSDALQALAGVRLPVDSHDAPTAEFVRLGSREALLEAAGEFFMRFRRRIAQLLGTSSDIGRALSKSLFDMADNAIQHSGDVVAGEEHPTPTPGAMAYQVEGRRVTFAVADVGQGALASLRTNPAFVDLADQRAALHASVIEGKSRRLVARDVHGFSDLHRGLASRSAMLRFASGDAVLKYDGLDGVRRVSWATRPHLVGFQLSVSVDL